ncbi:MAG: ABC transporter ATP-binding protein [Candidatus Omnitrophota bacterium]|nr:ABC transporter ATP-binding protein [Candidatus Omnitrophota bacterium]
MNNLLEVTSLTKIYHNGRENVTAVKNILLSLVEEDYLAIVGPSGAGKSTLLHIMGGLDIPSEGKVLFRSSDIYQKKDKELSLWRNKTIGFVFQFYHLIEELNVLENIAIAASLKERKFSLKKAQELLEYLNIDNRKNFFPSQLSGGEKQKVAIARALANDPEIVLCDEPTGNLDKDSQDKVVELLERLNKEKKKTIVLVTHNLELARRAKRIVFIKGGEIVK